MSAIGPGDFVECIAPADADGPFLFFGRVYRVSHFSESGLCEVCGDEGPSIELVGDVEDPDDGYCTCQFRPLYSPKAGLIQQLTQPAPERERDLLTAD